MIRIRKMDINADDARMLMHELNCVLEQITGDNGTAHFRQTDVEQERSVFLVGYIDEIPYACGALKKDLFMRGNQESSCKGKQLCDGKSYFRSIREGSKKL